jgi:hypothetical protein
MAGIPEEDRTTISAPRPAVLGLHQVAASMSIAEGRRLTLGEALERLLKMWWSTLPKGGQ